jgi:hypothetical protein
MFYYLLYNSSFSFIVENRLFSTVLYGSILYILTHAVLNYCDVSILTIINNYYWTLLTLDIISFSYAIYNSFINNDIFNNNSNDGSGESNNMNVSFNLLKNKINTMLDRKNDLTVTQIHDTNNNNNNNHNNNNHNNNQSNNKKHKNQIQEHFKNTENNKCNNFIDTNKINNTDPLDDLDFSDLEHIGTPSNELNSSAQFSTPINRLKKNNNTIINTNNNDNGNTNTNTNTNTASTPINLIRNNVKIEEPIVNDDTTMNTNCNESNAGSDVGSVMDLEDFEHSF